MKPHELQKQIAATEFLSGLSDRQVKLIADCACHTQFGEGDLIFREGDTANRFYLIEQGTVQLEAALQSGQRQVVAGTVGSGGVLGWSWLFEPYEWQFTARALTKTTAIFFYGTVLRQHCETDPSLGFELFKRMSAEMVRWLQSARNRLLEEQAGFSKVGAEHAMNSRG
jgi:CRP/FNR family cyclic AMP-dependent transcriptional regulator